MLSAELVNCSVVSHAHIIKSVARPFHNLGKRHISILSTRNVIWTLGGGGGVAPVTFLGEKSWKISIV